MDVEESNFVNFVTADIADFLCQAAVYKDRVLVFPPFLSRYRFLIHKIVQEDFPILRSFSVGGGYERRPVVCLTELFLGMNSENGHIVKTNELQPLPSQTECTEKISECHSSSKTSSQQQHNGTSRSKVKKPDMPIYVPRGRRISTGTHLQLGEESKSRQTTDDVDLGCESTCQLGTSKDQPGSDTKQQPNVCTDSDIKKKKSASKKKTPKKSSEISPDCQSRKPEKINRKLGVDSRTLAQSCRNSGEMEVEPSSQEPIMSTGNSCASSELVESVVNIRESSSDGVVNNCEVSVNDCTFMVKENALNSATFSRADETSTDDSGSSMTVTRTAVTVDAFQPSLSNRADTDIGKDDSFPISFPSLAHANKNPIGNNEQMTVKNCAVDIRTEDTVAVGSEQSWETLFDDSGEALQADIMTKITDALGTITVQKPQFDYLNYQPQEPEINDEEFEHLLEIYEFPASLQTADLVTAFKDFQDSGFEIKWVDDTHAIGIFSGRTAAKSALATFSHPLMKVRPIQLASRQTKLKAKKCTEFLLPYKPRPVMVASVARNLVAGALGLQTKVSKEKREEERQKIKAARDQKRAAKRQKEDVWEGKVGRCAMDEA